MKAFILTFTLLFGLMEVASSQVLITQSPVDLRACVMESTATSAGNAVSTVTLTPPAGQYVYVCAIYIAETANAAVTGAAGPLPIFTSTGLQTNLVFWGDNSSLTSGQLVKVTDSKFGFPIKTAAPGTAFTIASSGSGQSTYNTRMTVSGYFAP